MLSVARHHRPFVSIVCPTYNHERYIEASLTSALEQDWDPLEVVVSDDGSSDETARLVDDLGRRWSNRLRAIDGPHVGITANVNRALRNARGDLVAFLSGDDLFLPGKIAAQAAWFAESPDRVLCGHDLELIDSEDKMLGLWSDTFLLRSGSGPKDMILYGCFFGAISVMVRKHAIPSYGFDQRLRVASDWKFWIDVLRSGGAFGAVPGVWGRYRRHPASATATMSIACAEDHRRTLNLLEREYPELASACREARRNRADLRDLARFAPFDRSLWDVYQIQAVFNCLKQVVPVKLRPHLRRAVGRSGD